LSGISRHANGREPSGVGSPLTRPGDRATARSPSRLSPRRPGSDRKSRVPPSFVGGTSRYFSGALWTQHYSRVTVAGTRHYRPVTVTLHTCLRRTTGHGPQCHLRGPALARKENWRCLSH